MSSDSYTVTYFSFWGRADIVRMMLELAGAKYENKFIDKEWPARKADMKFGHVPVLTIHSADGASRSLYESLAMEHYLAEAFDFLPPNATLFDKMESFSYASALQDLRDKVWSPVTLPVDQRAAAHAKHRAETWPDFLQHHEKNVKGPFYYGDKVTYPDCVLYGLYLRYKQIYQPEDHPITAEKWPKLYALIQAMEKTKAGDYARNRRDFGVLEWKKDKFEFGPIGK